jgi:hypothetical protein
MDDPKLAARLVDEMERFVAEARAFLRVAATLHNEHVAHQSGTIRLSATGWRVTWLPAAAASLGEIRERGTKLHAADDDLARAARVVISAVADAIVSREMRNPGGIPWTLAVDDRVQQRLDKLGLNPYGAMILAIDEVEARARSGNLAARDAFGSIDDPKERAEAVIQARRRAESAALEAAKLPLVLLRGLALEGGINPNTPDLAPALIVHLARTHHDG